MTQGTTDALSRLAREHLPGEIAERWTGLLRPSIRLEKSSGPGPGPSGIPGPGSGPAPGAGPGAVVGRLGGLPRLPEGEEWPQWEGHGPLSFVAALDCAALPSAALDVALPAGGTLLFFYFDGQLDDGEAVVTPDEPDTWAGARVLYVPAGVPVAERPVPGELEPYPEVELTARVEPTAPYLRHPVVHREFGPERDGHPLWGGAFEDALWDHTGGTEHRIGGHATPVQDAVELEVARGALGGPPWDDPRIGEEALRWVLLAQFDSDDDADMMWGDCGALYWLIRPEDLAERRFERALLTWQCG
ncbi:YwqG family protein [Streptomyces sp. NPDC016309]|uniref:YwqG family protein n=1 Tax=Streptomyces sp. NPDC016309 TaxID=3364965 RepID=UPI0036FBBE39